jgi:hypothetical protein
MKNSSVMLLTGWLLQFFRFFCDRNSNFRLLDLSASDHWSPVRICGCYSSFAAVLWSINFLFSLQLRLSKSFGSGSRSGACSGSNISFVTTFYHRFHIKKSRVFMFFMKEYQPNAHAGSYTIWIFIFIYYLSWSRDGAETSIFQLQQQLRPKVLAPCGSGSTTLIRRVTVIWETVKTCFFIIRT